MIRLKKVRINKGKVALVFRNGDYDRVLTSGTHWLRMSENCMQFNLAEAFMPPIASELLLTDEKLKAMLHVIEVKDSQLVVVLEGGLFRKVLKTGKYFFWNTIKNYEFITIDRSKIYITEKLEKTWFSNLELFQHIREFQVAVHEKALLMVDDVKTKTLDAGVYRFWKNNTEIKLLKADMRVQQLEISGQELLTKDKAAIRINFYTQYQIVDVDKALLDNKDYDKQLYIAMQLALRAYVGTYMLDDLLDQKETIATAVFNEVVTDAAKLGVKVINCGIRDVILTGEMKEIMNQVLVAQKKAQANVITRREETAATRGLLNTAKLMEENTMLFKLKEMEYVEKIADKIGEITLTGNNGMVKQLMGLFSVQDN